ncbi:MAG: DNA (cytosine-5-)-methyltransferase [Gammaproteobacteria bacterium]|nr:DNA (cytosine-5-)-methyltransferase [Gammaproteobacteria bacterium]
MNELRVGSLFAGIGSFDLGFERAGGFRTVWFSEIDRFCSAVLDARFPGIPNHGDITAIRGCNVEPVDVLVGGFPCTDISVAGRGAGIEGPESGLWREFARLAGELRPRWIVIENSRALRNRGYDRVASQLEALGYAVWPFVVSAADVGAVHLRERVWVIAHTDSERCRELGLAEHSEQQSTPGREPDRLGTGRPGQGAATADADDDSLRLEQWGTPRGPRTAGPQDDGDARHAPDTLAPRLPLPECEAVLRAGWRYERRAVAECDRARPWDAGPPVAPVCLVDDWTPDSLVRHRRPALRALGNSLLPQIAEIIARAIRRVEDQLRGLH